MEQDHGVKVVRVTEEDRKRALEARAAKKAQKENISEKDRLKKKKYWKLTIITAVGFVLALITLAGMAAGVLSSKIGIVLLMFISSISVFVSRSASVNM